MNIKELSIILPCYNEADNIVGMVDDVLQYMNTLPIKYEIIIVNDGSSDGTGRMLSKIKRLFPSIKVINHRHNKGYGASLQTGFSHAQYSWIFFTDSDRQFSMADLTHLLTYSQSFDMIIGYRKNRQDAVIRIINAKTFNVIVRIFFQLHVKDIDCAFKLFKKEIIQTISLQSHGALINTELLTKAKMNGFSIKEVPVEHFPRTRGKATGANITVILKAMKELFDFRFRSFSNS